MMTRNRLLVAALIVAGLAPTVAAAQDDRPPVAVLRYDNNTDDPKYNNLGRALSTMMISDLSVVEEIQLIERDRLEEILGELQLQQTVYVDPATAQTVGLIVGAEYVVAGAFMAVDPEIRLDARIVRVETSEIVKTAEVSGPSNELLTLQERLADEFIDGLAITLTEEERERLREQQRANSLGTMEAMLAFSSVLCLFDHGAYLEAFEEAERLREAAPASAIVGMTTELLKQRVEDEAKSRLRSEANRRIGGLLGRSSRNREPERPPRPDAC